MPTRRTFLHQSTLLAGAVLLPFASHTASARKFTLSLRPGAIGISEDDLRANLQLVYRHGFEALDADAGGIARLDAGLLAELRAEMQTRGIVWGAPGVPVVFQQDEDRFRQDLLRLPAIAAGLARAGVTRTGTWLMPRHDSLTYLSNFRQHVRRLREIARILGDHGIRFGLEYVGPKTLRAPGRYAFIYSLRETRELIAEIGLANMGVVLDSFHWYTAGETVTDLLDLSAQDIVACDLNDAVAGRTPDEQIDGQRELPTATGVIDLRAFLQALLDLGYDGPVRAEPFNRPLNELDDDAAAQATAQAMRKAFALVGG
ncbi:MAG: sugar phosphate isomerase/epimerase [Bacteroidia bacterium]